MAKFKLNWSKHWWVLVLAIVAVLLIAKGQGFLGALVYTSTEPTSPSAFQAEDLTSIMGGTYDKDYLTETEDISDIIPGSTGIANAVFFIATANEDNPYYHENLVFAAYSLVDQTTNQPILCSDLMSTTFHDKPVGTEIDTGVFILSEDILGPVATVVMGDAATVDSSSLFVIVSCSYDKKATLSFYSEVYNSTSPAYANAKSFPWFNDYTSKYYASHTATPLEACQMTQGTWDTTTNRCACPAGEKFSSTDGCLVCTDKPFYNMSDFCAATHNVCMLDGEATPPAYFLDKAACTKSLQCTNSAGCSKSINAPNDCSLFFQQHNITQSGTCTAGVCIFPTITSTICTSSELWWQSYIIWIIALSSAVVVIGYLLWERGPKRGFFRK